MFQVVEMTEFTVISGQRKPEWTTATRMPEWPQARAIPSHSRVRWRPRLQPPKHHRPQSPKSSSRAATLRRHSKRRSSVPSSSKILQRHIVRYIIYFINNLIITTKTSFINSINKLDCSFAQVPETQYSRARSQRQSSKQSPKGSSKRSQEIANDNSSGAGVDGKPHIVMRICKGTSLIVGGIENVGQNAQEPEPDTYRITQPMASPNSLHIDRKNSSPTSASSSPAKTDRVTRSHQSIVQTTTVSIPIESNTETRRTTRSRAKNLQIDTQSAQVTIIVILYLFLVEIILLYLFFF